MNSAQALILGAFCAVLLVIILKLSRTKLHLSYILIISTFVPFLGFCIYLPLESWNDAQIGLGLTIAICLFFAGSLLAAGIFCIVARLKAGLTRDRK